MSLEPPSGAQLAERVLARLRKAAPLAEEAELSWLLATEAAADEACAALGWALEAGEVEIGLELSLLMARYWWVLGCRSEGRGWLEAFLKRGAGARPELLSRARQWLAELAGADDPA